MITYDLTQRVPLEQCQAALRALVARLGFRFSNHHARRAGVPEAVLHDAEGYGLVRCERATFQHRTYLVFA